MGQIGCNFKTRYKAHINDIIKNKIKSGYTHNVKETGQFLWKNNAHTARKQKRSEALTHRPHDGGSTHI
jgi:hypothetical protein